MLNSPVPMKKQSTELLFEMSHPGRRTHSLPECDVPVNAEVLLPPEALGPNRRRCRRSARST